MTDLGYSTPPSTPPAPEPEHEIPMWVIWTALALLVVGAATVAAALLTELGGKTEKQNYPDSWDPRILPYVRATEQQRGLTFQHPVAVRFVTGAEFEKGVRVDEKELDDEDKADIERTTGLLRALGLLHGDVDLFSAVNDTQGSSTLAYYSFADQTITVRGKQLVLASHATLVHELTHALQDQRFGVGKRFQELSRADGPTTAEADVLRAVVEGDAERTSQLYRDSLPARQRKRLLAAETTFEGKVGDKIPDVPPVVTALFGAPYALGQGLVETVAQERPGSGLDDLLRDPPTHDAALLDPYRVVTGQTKSVRVTAPKAADGEKKFDSGEFGALTWYLVLAERLPLRDALAAVDGWGGDAYVSYTRDKQSCVRITYAGRTQADTARMHTALVRWQQAVPGTPASTTQDGAELTFQTCDPGTKVRGGSGSSTDALRLVATRTSMGLTMSKQGAPAKVAFCLSGKMAAAFTLPQLNDRAFAERADTRARIAGMVAACR